jgi:GH24 family phage-related lysozyme (muramidase)
MNLNTSRALWRRREISRYRRWKKAKKASDRSRYYKLYIEARDARRNRDRQIAKAHASAHTVSDAGVALVAEFEGFRAHAYRDVVGVLTQGYGETQGVTPGQAWTEAHARARLRERLNRDYVPAVLAANKKLTQHQLDGFASFAYNVGAGGVASSTQVGKYLRSGNVKGAANAILAWSKAGGQTLPGLLARRQKERALILK